MLAIELVEQIRYAMRLSDDQDDTAYARAIDVLNQAGQRLVTAKSWMFLGGGKADVEIDEEGYALLPPDFQEINSVYYTDRSRGANLTTAEAVQAMEKGQHSLYVAPTWVTTDKGYLPYLVCNQVGPQSLSVTYRRGWRVIQKNEDVIGMPEFMRPLLAEVCRKYADLIEGVDESNGASKVDQIFQGPLMREAMRSDGRVQRNYGMHGNQMGQGTSTYVPIGSNWLTPNA